MIKKINSIYKFFLIFFILILLLFSRLVGLNWGLPYPMHPDERNMAVSLQQLNCQFSKANFDLSFFKECFNPHFFAYGQFPLYLGYLLAIFLKFFKNTLDLPISFEEATLALRFLSSFFSILSFFYILKIVKIISEKKISFFDFFSISLLIIFSPFFIQYSHFGTTESLLMFLYIFLIYLGFSFYENKISDFYFIFYSGIFSGIALATKVSSIFFLLVPILFLFTKKYTIRKNKKIFYFRLNHNHNFSLIFYSFFLRFFDFIFLGFISILFFFIFSPHNFLNFNDFYSSIDYESGVGVGRYIVFYTQQFVESIPFLFQIFKIFPFVLGPLLFFSFFEILSIFKNFLFDNFSSLIKKKMLLLFIFLFYFIPNAFLFAKWTRFMTPIFPLFLIFGILFFLRLKSSSFLKIFLVFLFIFPGIFYLLIYLKPDIRFEASEWIFKNIPENSYILSETANVIDIPIIFEKQKIKPKSYNLISFDFYNLDKSFILQDDLKNHLEKADYIIVPSRRIFANYTCYWPNKKENLLDKIVYSKKRCVFLKENFPLLNDYYHSLFSGKSGFRLVKEFSSFDFGFFRFDDEIGEETLSVFDHPVIRIYKKI